MDEEREEGPQVIAKQELLQVKTKALRLKIWFKALSKTERAIIDLTLKYVEQIRSSILEATITGILDKIVNVLEQRFLTRADKIGREAVEKLVEVADKWGNKEASAWKLDLYFIRFLGVNTLNN